jgi:hypothetical protein
MEGGKRLVRRVGEQPGNTTGHKKKRIEMPVCGYKKIFLKDPAALPKRRDQIKKPVEGYPTIPMKSIASLRALSVFPLTDIFASLSPQIDRVT